jgi:hypothetical protein
MPLGPPFRVERRDMVRRVFIALEESLGRHVFVARFAGFRANVERRIGGPLVGFRLTGRLPLGSCLLSPTLTNQQRHAHESGKKQQKPGPAEIRSHAHVHPPIKQSALGGRPRATNTLIRRDHLDVTDITALAGCRDTRKGKLAADYKEVPVSLTETRPDLTGYSLLGCAGPFRISW